MLQPSVSNNVNIFTLHLPSGYCCRFWSTKTIFVNFLVDLLTPGSEYNLLFPALVRSSHLNCATVSLHTSSPSCTELRCHDSCIWMHHETRALWPPGSFRWPPVKNHVLWDHNVLCLYTGPWSLVSFTQSYLYVFIVKCHLRKKKITAYRSKDFALVKKIKSLAVFYFTRVLDKANLLLRNEVSCALFDNILIIIQ